MFVCVHLPSGGPPEGVCVFVRSLSTPHEPTPLRRRLQRGVLHISVFVLVPYQRHRLNIENLAPKNAEIETFSSRQRDNARRRVHIILCTLNQRGSSTLTQSRPPSSRRARARASSYLCALCPGGVLLAAAAAAAAAARRFSCFWWRAPGEPPPLPAPSRNLPRPPRPPRPPALRGSGSACACGGRTAASPPSANTAPSRGAPPRRAASHGARSSGAPTWFGAQGQC